MRAAANPENRFFDQSKIGVQLSQHFDVGYIAIDHPLDVVRASTVSALYNAYGTDGYRWSFGGEIRRCRY
jgi:hypothetical protein